jgi:signal transduction histidine kinase
VPVQIQSLRFRLLAAAGLALLLAMLLIGGFLVWVYEHQLRERTKADLLNQLNHLAAIVMPDDLGSLTLGGRMTDPRYDEPLGGLYWQIDVEDESTSPPTFPPVSRSRSLWDERLDVGRHAVTYMPVTLDLPGPDASHLMALTQDVEIRTPPDAKEPTCYRLTVALDLAGLEAARADLVRTLAWGLGGVFVALLLASWGQIEYGLVPLKTVRREVERIRTGLAGAIDSADFPTEVLPLAEDINTLIASQQEATERARARAGDLAHGLKTPLAALSALADELARKGDTETSTGLRQSIATMRRHVERELALVRSRGSLPALGVARLNVGERIAETIALLDRLPRPKGQPPLRWQVEGEVRASVRMEAEDFDEVVGNLLDNARKYAEERIVIRVANGASVDIAIIDDGPGIAAPDVSRALERGTRLDERQTGSGLGLAIAQAILDSYGGTLTLSPAAPHGLEARVVLPAPDAPLAAAVRGTYPTR